MCIRSPDRSSGVCVDSRRNQPDGQPGLGVPQGHWPLLSKPPQCSNPLGKDSHDGDDGFCWLSIVVIVASPQLPHTDPTP